MSDPTSNPLLAPSTLPYALPPFAQIRDEHLLPAIEAGIAEQRAEVAAIVDNPEPATVENTLVALERSGQTLARAHTVAYMRSAADSTPFLAELEETVAPLLAAHEDSIRLDSRLFARISELRAQRDEIADAETRHLLDRYHEEFTLAGAALDEERKEQLRALNMRLSTLAARFEKNLLADSNDLAVLFATAEELDGLTAAELAGAEAAATERGMSGYLLGLVLPTSHPLLSRLTVRESRRRLLEASLARGSRGGEHDTREIVLESARLRAERAALLGFDSHADAIAAESTAHTSSAVMALLERLAPVASENAREEQAALEGLAGHPIKAWDWAFYTEQLRRRDHQLDTESLRSWFEAERVLRDGVFFAAERLYGLTFTERDDLEAYHPDARVFEVFDHGDALGLFVLDLYTRDSKRGGAWMNPLVSQNSLLGHPPVVVNNLNVPKPPPGSPTLLTLDEVTTLFHEFGHALHGLLATVTYPRFAGTNVPRDFVEFPSQVNEMWMLWPEVVERYAVHHETGEPLPVEVIERLRASEQFNEGFATSEYLAAALLDQAWHRLTHDDEVTDVAAFEARALASAGLDLAAVPTRYSSAYFAHIFAGGYSAAYYSYIWSEVLDADTVEWFTENGGLTPENGDRFRQRLLGVGGSKDPLEAYRDFRGREAKIEPLLRRRGLDRT